MARSPRSDGAGADRFRRLREFQERVRKLSPPEVAATAAERVQFLGGSHGEILTRLRQQSPSLSDSLVQALTDLHDPNRLTYVGPAGEAREVMRAAIQIFAPDEAIRRQPWFEGVKQGSKTNPSQSERLRYAVQRSGGDHRQAEDAVDMIDERIGRLGRNVYQRASAAFHAKNQRQEVRKLTGWVFVVLDEILPESV